MESLNQIAKQVLGQPDERRDSTSASAALAEQVAMREVTIQSWNHNFMMKHRKYAPKVGDKHGRLTVVSFKRSGNGILCLCKCACGNTREFRASLLYWPKQRHHAACGMNGCTYNFQHGHKSNKNWTREYCSWRSMMGRCQNPNDPAWRNYGGRGIRVCHAWTQSFSAFLRDMGERPIGKELGRINNDRNYEPQNCRWETRSQQANNRRSNRHLTFRGETLNVVQWSRKLGVPKSLLQNRIYSGWSVERTLTERKYAR
jgi:hypothetical protein